MEELNNTEYTAHERVDYKQLNKYEKKESKK